MCFIMKSVCNKYKFKVIQFSKLFVFSLLVWLSLASCMVQYKAPQLSTENIESFVYNDKEYIIHNMPTKWEEALIICRGFNSTLAVLDNQEKAQFVTEALSESEFVIDSVWVGARRSSILDADGYRWVAGSRTELMKTSKDIMTFQEGSGAENHYPLWLNRTDVPVIDNGANCVGLTRVHHSKPLFLDLPCEVDRPFVCEKDAPFQFQGTEPKTARCKSSIYHVFDGRMTWEQAATYCIMANMTLAQISSMECLRKVGYTMLKFRPSIENAWIGARVEAGVWRWLSDGKNVFRSSPHAQEVQTWPPMRNKDTLKHEGCMQIDRHTSSTPLFLETRCGRRMQFVCQNIKEDASEAVEPPSDDYFFYILIREKTSWQRAYDNCWKMNGALASVDNSDIVTNLLLLMGENKDLPISHVWISGRLNMTRQARSNILHYAWYNPASGKIIPDKKNANTNDYVPPWLEDDFTTDNSCLNLDRENHLSGLVYGLPCDTLQPSICMIEKSILNRLSNATNHTSAVGSTN